MSIMVRYVCLLVLILLAATWTAHAMAKEEQSPSLQPDPAVQSLIAKFAEPTEEDIRQYWRAGQPDEKALTAYFSDLKAVTGGRNDVLVQQLLLYGARATDVQGSMGPLAISEQMKISKDDIAEATIPLLESDDSAIRQAANEWLTGTDQGVGEDRVNFARYEAIFRQVAPIDRPGLVRYMYARNPEAAVLTFAKIFGGQDVKADISLRLEQDAKLRNVLADATKQERRKNWDYFLRRPEWWSRLYVVAEIEGHPEMRSLTGHGDLVRQLKKDDHSLVRTAAADIK